MSRADELWHCNEGRTEFFNYAKELEKEKNELAAQVEVMRMALSQISCASRATVCNQKWVAKRADSALSITGTDALREIQARTQNCR